MATRRAKSSGRLQVVGTRNGHGREIVLNGNGRKPKTVAWWESFEGARAGGYRGYIFLPGGLNTEKTMRQMTRHKIAERNVWAYNNIPEMRAIIDGLAIDEIDTAIWPKARTSNPVFNKAATTRFDEENKEPRTFDLRKTDNVYSGEFLMRRTCRLIGDLFGQLVRPFTPLASPKMGFLPGYQCTSDGTDSAVREGIRFDEFDAPAAYRFAKPKKEGQAQQYVELAADDVLHFHDPFLGDQIRGISTLAPVTRQMFSMDDIDRAETAGQLLRSRVAYAVETVGSDEGEIPKLPGTVAVEVIKHKGGGKTIIQKVMSRDGNEVDVFTPPSGMKIKTLESNRGGAIDFRQFLAGGMMYCTVYPPEWILKLMGLSQGTVARVVQNRVQKIANFYRAMQVDYQFMQRWYRYWLWQRIKAGVFDGVAGGVPDDWWAHKVLYPRDMSVDLGRDGRLYDDRVMRGNMSPVDYHALAGRDDEDVDEEIIDSAIRRRELLTKKLAEHPGVEIEYREVFLLPPGTANTAAAVESDTVPPTPPADSTQPPVGKP